MVHYFGLDAHKESTAVSIAPAHSTAVRRYGIIGGSLDAVDKPVKKLATENVELPLIYEAGPTGFVLCVSHEGAADRARGGRAHHLFAL